MGNYISSERRILTNNKWVVCRENSASSKRGVEDFEATPAPNGLSIVYSYNEYTQNEQVYDRCTGELYENGTLLGNCYAYTELTEPLQILAEFSYRERIIDQIEKANGEFFLRCSISFKPFFEFEFFELEQKGFSVQALCELLK